MNGGLKECPRCGLRNPKSAVGCDCGYAFETSEKLSVGVKLAVGMAFFQIAATTLLLRTFEGQYLIGAIGAYGLAIATFKRHLWGGYGLLGYGVAHFADNTARLGRPAWVVPLLLYFIGVVALHRSQHIAPTLRELNWKRITILSAIWFGGNSAIAVALSILLRGGDPTVVEVCLFGMWGVTVVYIAATRSRWPLETILSTGVFSIVPELLGLPFEWISWKEFLASGVSAIAFGMVGWRLASLFPQRRKV